MDYKILILGDGVLGTELHQQTGWDVVSYDKDGFDLLDPNRYWRYMIDYDCVVNCTGFTTMHSDRERNMLLNFEAVIDLVDQCNLYDIKYVHISTDIVYAGSVMYASEDDVPVHAPNWYAYSKLLADGYVQTICTDYLLIRTAFKPRPFPYSVAVNKVGNFDYVDVIGDLIVRLIQSGAEGVYNVGTELKSMHQHALETVPDIELLEDSEMVDVSMNLRKMSEIL